MVLSSVVSLFTLRVQPENKVEAYKKLLREKGEKLAIGELLPPPVPAASNSVAAVEEAFRLFGSGNENIPNAMRMVAPGKALVGWQQPEARGYDFTNSWDDYAAEIAANDPAIQLLHQVLARPQLDFQLDYKKNFDLLLPHLAPLKRAAQKLDATAIYNLHNGDPGAATTNILTMLGLVQRNAAEGILISHLVRIAITAIAITPTWELLQTTNVTDAQLTALQAGWQQLDFLRDATNVFPLERAWGIDSIEKARASHAEFEKIFGLVGSMGSFGSSSSGSSGSLWSWPPDWESATERPRYAVGEAMWRSSWSYSDELRSLQSGQIILETLRMMQTNQSQFYKADYDVMVKRLSSLGITNVGRAFFRALKIPDMSEMFGSWSLSGYVQKTLRIETARRVAVAAVALKRFQLAHGKLPETLAALVPEFLPSVPIDPHDGKPLRYHPAADGTFLLYCVGEDGVDDGGDPSLGLSTSTNFQWQNNRARDWVWPQPATEAEIKLFYDTPPK